MVAFLFGALVAKAIIISLLFQSGRAFIAALIGTALYDTGPKAINNAIALIRGDDLPFILINPFGVDAHPIIAGMLWGASFATLMAIVFAKKNKHGGKND